MTNRVYDGDKVTNNPVTEGRKDGGGRKETINLTDKKKVIDSMKGVFAWILPLYFILWLTHPSLPAVIIIITCFIIVRRLYEVVKNKKPFMFKRTLKAIVESSLFISVLYGVFFLFQGYGLLAAAVAVSLIVGYRIYKQRVMFNDGLDQIMVMIKGEEYTEYLNKKKRGKQK